MPARANPAFARKSEGWGSYFIGESRVSRPLFLQNLPAQSQVSRMGDGIPELLWMVRFEPPATQLDS